MTAAPTMAITIESAWLAVALIVYAVGLAAIFAAGELVGDGCGDAVHVAVKTVLVDHFLRHRVIDLRRERPRAEAAFNERIALQISVLRHLTTALAIAVIV